MISGRSALNGLRGARMDHSIMRAHYCLPLAATLVASAFVAPSSIAQPVEPRPSQPPPVPATKVEAPVIMRIGNLFCAGDESSPECQQIYRDDAARKLGVSVAWQRCGFADCFAMAANIGIYRWVPAGRGGGFTVGTLVASAPFSTKNVPWGRASGQLFAPEGKIGECFVARAFSGAVDKSYGSPPSDPVCVTASTPIGAETVTVSADGFTTRLVKGHLDGTGATAEIRAGAHYDAMLAFRPYETLIAPRLRIAKGAGCIATVSSLDLDYYHRTFKEGPLLPVTPHNDALDIPLEALMGTTPGRWGSPRVGGPDGLGVDLRPASSPSAPDCASSVRTIQATLTYTRIKPNPPQ